LHACDPSHQSSCPCRGVHFFRPTRMWQARFSQDNQTLCLGNFFSEMEAARAFDKKAVRCQGPRARTNFQVEDYPEELRLWREENGGAEAELPVSCGEEGEEEEEECSAADPRAAAAAASPAGSRAPTDLRREGAGGSGSAAAEPSLAGRRQGEPQASRADGGMSAHWGATARSPDSQQTDLWRQIGTSLAIEACREASSETLGGSITLSPQRTPRRPRPRKRAGTPVSAPQPKRPKGGARPPPPAAPRGAAAPAPSSRLRSGALLKPPGSRSEAAPGKPQGRTAKRPLAPGKSIAERVRRSAWAAPARVRNAATRTLTDIARAKAASARMHLSPATPAKAERAADAKGKAGQVTRAAKPAPGEAVSDKRELTLYKLLEADIPGSIPPPKDRPRRGVSQYRGVTRQHSRWKAQLVYSHHVYHIGLFETEVEAAKAFDQVIVRIWGRQVKHLSNFNIDNYKKQLREHRNRQIATAGIRKQPARRAAMEIKP